MFVVSNLSGVVIAKFRTMTQVNAWAKRLEIIMENVTVRFIVVRTSEGRWTAIVQLDKTKGGYAGRYQFLKM